MNGKFKIITKGTKKELFIDDFNIGYFTSDLKLELNPNRIPGDETGGNYIWMLTTDYISHLEKL